MIHKALGQLVITALMTGFFPANGGYYEWQAGVDSTSAVNGLVSEEVRGLMTFPEADERPVVDYPVKVDMDSYGIVTSAQSAMVVDAESGMVMFAKHPDQVRSIGSVTKLMSALVFLDQNPDLDQIVRLNIETDLVEGGRIYLAFDDGLTLRDVLGASLVGSDNTATQALARFVNLSEQEFVTKMNEKAHSLGLESTSFVDPTGVLAENVSTARDLAKLLDVAEQNDIMKHFMMTSKLSITQNSGRVIEIENTNGLLTSFLNDGQYQIVGGKTGFLPQAGYVLATSVKRGEDQIYVIILGSDSKDSRVAEAKGLAAWAFRVFKWPE